MRRHYERGTTPAKVIPEMPFIMFTPFLLMSSFSGKMANNFFWNIDAKNLIILNIKTLQIQGLNKFLSAGKSSNHIIIVFNKLLTGIVELYFNVSEPALVIKIFHLTFIFAHVNER